MISIFVGCAPNHDDAESQAVLEYSIRKHASAPVDIVWMKLSRDPASPFYSNPERGEGWRTERWPTPFSGFRWAVPELCGYHGRAIYIDSDFIVLADIAELWGQSFAPGKIVMNRGGNRFCISLWDCAAARPHMPRIGELQADRSSHHRMQQTFSRSTAVQRFEGAWNALDGEGFADLSDPRLKAIHYTDMSTQPHLVHAVPRLAAAGRQHWYNGLMKPHRRRDLVALFDRLLEEAKAAGFPPERYTQEPIFGDFPKASLMGYRGRHPRAA